MKKFVFAALTILFGVAGVVFFRSIPYLPTQELANSAFYVGAGNMCVSLACFIKARQ